MANREDNESETQKVFETFFSVYEYQLEQNFASYRIKITSLFNPEKKKQIFI